MKKPNIMKSKELVKDSLSAVLLVSATSFFLMIGNRALIGEGVISLVLLLAVAWSAYHWGLAAGMSAALSAGLMFDFFFIPPFYTFTIDRPEGILILFIFFMVAVVVVESIQTTLSKARSSENEAVTMYEFSTMLAGMRSQEAIARGVARFIRQRFLAEQVSFFIQFKDQANPKNIQEPADRRPATAPDCVVPILTAWGLTGELQVWHGEDVEIPAADSRLFRNIALQVGLAIERVQITEYEFAHPSIQGTAGS